jgi:LysM repeat protein
MSETDINSELLTADARGRKNIPFAVFAVIFIHIVLFVVLLIAAGCRAKARARRNNIQQEVVKAESTREPVQAPAVVTNTPTPLTQIAEPVLVTEPVIEDEPEPIQKAVSRPVAERPTANAGRMQLHVVQPGDSIGKIAKHYGVTVQAIRTENNLKSNVIRVGQKLRVSTEKARRPKDTLATL